MTIEMIVLMVMVGGRSGLEDTVFQLIFCSLLISSFLLVGFKPFVLVALPNPNQHHRLPCSHFGCFFQLQLVLLEFEDHCRKSLVREALPGNQLHKLIASGTFCEDETSKQCWLDLLMATMNVSIVLYGTSLLLMACLRRM